MEDEVEEEEEDEEEVVVVQLGMADEDGWWFRDSRVNDSLLHYFHVMVAINLIIFFSQK